MAARARTASPDPVEDALRRSAAGYAAFRLRGVRLPEAELAADMAAPAQALCILTGPPGSGKTALVDVLRLARLAREGAMEMLGEDPRRLKGAKLAGLRRQIGVVQQTPRLFEHMSARDNLCVPLRLAGQEEAAIATKATQLCAYVGLDEADPRPAFALSETVRRRVALARALALRPDIIVADEPAGGLGPEAAGRIIKILFSMPKAGATVVIATQDETLAEAAPTAFWFRIAAGRIEPARLPGPLE